MAVVAANILKPSRINSLGRIEIRIVEHIYDSVEPNIFTIQAYPFERVLSIKQRIALHFASSVAHLPEFMFIARKRGDGLYTPIEFSWNIENDGQLHDPLDPEYVNVPDPRLYDAANNRISSKFAREHSGILYEDIAHDADELHIWTLQSLVVATGLHADIEIPANIMEGYFQLYFPRISKLALLQDFERRLTAGESEDLEAAQFYHTELDKRLAKIDTLLPSLPKQPCTLKQLYRVRYLLAPKPDFTSNADLELAFYESKVSEILPFIRYFPGNQRLAPMVKLAESSTTHMPQIEQGLLSKMLRDIPEIGQDAGDETKYGVLMYKIPVSGSNIPAETMWTLSVLGNDGSAELVLQAPRKDNPLMYDAVQAAFGLVPAILNEIGYNADIELKLVELNASYSITSGLVDKKPSMHDLKRRIDIFQSFLAPSRKLESQRTSFTLRYKTVSNYLKESNPIFDHLTLVTFDKGKSELLKPEEYIYELKSHFGLSQAFASSYIAEWSARYAQLQEEGKSILDTANPGGLVGVVADHHPVYDFILLHIQSQRDLERIISCMSIFVSYTTDELVVADEPDKMVEFAVANAAVDAAGVQDEAADAAEAAKAAEDMVADAAGAAGNELAGLEGMGDFMTQLTSLGVDLGNVGLVEEAVQRVEAEEAAKAAAEAAARAEEAAAAAKPPGSASKVKYSDDEVDYMSRLKQRNVAMFQYKLPPEKKTQTYVKSCQSAQGRQPNVMSFAQYKRAREIYKDAVTWVEGPLDENDAEAVMIASKAVGSRAIPIIPGNPRRKDIDIYKFEKHALELGFPLKNNESITTTKSGMKTFSDDQRAEIAELIAIQSKKPLWIVYRLGTTTEEGIHTNYYICAEYWCLHDDLPLLPTIVESTGKCPFCNGRIIQNTKSPGLGETVLKRKDNGSHKYIGFVSELRHPGGYAQPCCFKTPDSVLPPKDSNKEYPPRQLELPPQQAAAAPPAAPAAAALAPIPEEATTAAPAAEEADAAETPETDAATATKVAVGDVYRDRPFTVKRDKVKKNEWFIPHQKIIGRTIEGWVDITPKFRGTVSVPPQTVNNLLQQNPETFLTAIRGVQAKSQNSYLAVPGRAFVRYGLGTDLSTPGENLFALIAFAEYATSFLHDENANVTIRSNESVMEFMTSDHQLQMNRMVNVFEQANYGTLLHEFSVPQTELDGSLATEFEAWWKKTSGRYNNPSDRTYAIQTYLAFQNFMRYIKDTSMKKDLRYFTSFFATPKLLTSFGFIPIVINYYRKNTPAKLMCPEFGISFYHQDPAHRPPLLFIVHDVESGIFDPLVLYEGVKGEDGGADEQRIVGLIHPATPSFARLSSDLRASLQGFIDKYFSPAPDSGCARSGEYTHPWMPVRSTARVPRLSDVLHVLDLKDPTKESRDKHVLTGGIRKEALYRDRSNRLIGVIVRCANPTAKYVLLPCIDDGSIALDLKNVHGDLYDQHATFKMPSFEDIFFVLTGKQTKIDNTRIVGHFPEYDPVKLILQSDEGEYKYIAVETSCGIWIPAAITKKGDVVRDSRFKDLEKKATITSVVKSTPWSLNMAVVGPMDPDAETIAYTSEEELDESYQLFRIAFSEWLRTSRNGDFVRDQIELLRRARARLPLYELQKRLEILITAIVNPANPAETWFTTRDGKVTRPIYRRNCLKLKKGECSGGCMWVPSAADTDVAGRCLIHTTATERYIDPVRTLIARLVDELLRTFSLADEVLTARVPRLQPIEQGAVTHEDGSLVFSLPGRGDDDLFEQLGYTGRKPTAYTRGLVFPEETSLPIELDEGDIPGDMPGSWTQVFRHLTLGDDADRNPYLKFQIVFSVLSGIHYDAYEKLVGHPIRGTDADWNELAEKSKLQIIMTSVDPSIQLLQPYKRVGNIESSKFVVLDGNQIPFQNKFSGAIIFALNELPQSIRAWLSTQGIAEAAAAPGADTKAVAPFVLRKATDAAVSEKPKAKKTRGKTTYPAGRTMTNGDCFFSAIFRAAKERGKPVLDALAKCLGVSIVSEPKFIAAFRNKIGGYIAAGNLPSNESKNGRVNTYDVFVEIVSDPAQYKALIESYPDWFEKTFGSNGELLGTREEFISRLAEQVRKSGNWVSEIEVTLVKDMLAACNVIIRIANSNKIKDIGELKLETDDGKTILNLWNQGESHYVYFTSKTADADEDAAGGAGAGADADEG